MKRVLVTGANGFIGARTTAFLTARGFQVHAIGRRRPTGQVEFHQADLLRVDELQAALAEIRASHLLHLAWDVSPGRYWCAPENLDWVCASLQLLRAFAAAGGRRAVIAGTCAEYQWGQPRFLENTTPCEPATLYGAAKNGLRQIVESFGVNTGLSIGWGRIFFLFGPGEKSGRLVSDAIRSLTLAQPLLTTHGNQRRDFLHVDDVAGAFAALVDCEVAGAVNIGSGHAVSVRTLLEAIASQIGNGDCLKFGARALPQSEPPIIEADPTRLSCEVGFTPQYDLVGGLSDTIAWWNHHLRPPR
jgi:nucleoside-diphosphate-sugar epimerase